jgi:hypothetical protein
MKYILLTKDRPKFECKVCGYIWIPNKKGIISKPKSCANRQCRSRLWEFGLNNWKKYNQKSIKCYYSKTGCIIAISHTRGKNKIYHKISRDGKQWLLHRWVFYIYNGYEPSVVMHTCDNTDCINPLHLIGGTREENEKDKLMKGRQAKGEKNGTTKLTEKQIIKIIKLLNKRQSCVSISKKFKVCSSDISHIKNKKIWKYLTKNLYITKDIYRAKGENKSNSKLKEKDVIQIKKLLFQDVSPTEIAKLFNVSNQLIQHIKKGRAWKYLK